MPITMYTIVHPPAAPVAAAYANAETNTLAATISPSPPAAWLQAVDTMISSLKSAGVWSTFDLFYCFAAPSQNACNYNWVNPLVGLLTPHGSLTYQPYSYVASDGSTGWFSTTFGVNSGKAVDGSAEFGHFCLSEDSTDGISVFQTTGGNSHTSLVASATGATINNMTGGLNTSTTGTWSSQWGSTVGHWVLQQEDTSSTLEAFLDGASLGTQVQTHGVDSGTVQIFKSPGGSYTTRQTAIVHYGSKLTAPQQLALSQALYTFLAAVGVKPLAGYLGLSTGPTNVAPYKHVSTGSGNSLYVPGPPGMGLCEVQGHGAAYPRTMINVNDPNYLNLWRFEIHAGDYAPYDSPTKGVDRIHLTSSFTFPFQTTCDISFSLWIESGSAIGSADDFCTLYEVHDSGAGVVGGPIHALTVPQDGGVFGKFFTWGFLSQTGTNINNWNPTSTANCAQGQWHHVRTTFRPDNAPNGFCKTWFDGVQILNYTGAFCNSTLAPYRPIMSLYRGDDTSGTAPPMAVWYANVEFDASGTQPFSSRINNPLPTPPLV
ncbi:hypothetical protein [Bradyrhizobium sp. Tv2a-2]|uniref:hypothetical protein n=1 Tax=Bradyrhizobium sp. Tv2a-2 TaxID=113395 RepID=UPI0004056F0A|nr:hypothetical protein [Bradyrhizobium sp. Tv2a-2]